MTDFLNRLKAIPYLPVIVGLTALRLVTAARAGLVPDEAYYWLWSQHPALGYYDHPPMVAWWIGLSTAVFGQSPLAVRLPFVLSFLALTWLMFDTAKALFNTATARRTILWLNACLLLSIGSVIATPDPPSVLMWAAGLWALARLQASGKGYWWLVFGLAAGLGVEAKYTNLFLGLGLILWVALEKESRRWLTTRWPYLGGLIAAAAMAPNLMWNAAHDFATFGKQFGRIEANGFTARYLIEFLLSQPLLLNPLIAVFACLCAAAWVKKRSDSRLTLLVALPLPLLAYMLVHVFHDRIQGNWPAPVFPGLVILAAAAAESARTKGLIWLRDWAAPLGITLSAVALIYLGLGDSGPKLTGAAGLSQGWPHLTQQIRMKQAQAGARYVVTTDYDTQGELSYHLRGTSVIAVSERQRYGWPTPEKALGEQTALIVVPLKDSPNLALCFNGLNDLGVVSRLKKPGAKSDFRLYSGTLIYPGCEVP